jgi:hypothetical protein
MKVIAFAFLVLLVSGCNAAYSRFNSPWANSTQAAVGGPLGSVSYSNTDVNFGGFYPGGVMGANIYGQGPIFGQGQGYSVVPLPIGGQQVVVPPGTTLTPTPAQVQVIPVGAPSAPAGGNYVTRQEFQRGLGTVLNETARLQQQIQH